ncbi:MAG TPA: DUF4200 domain-containing protein [Phycisphaerae bacterium]|nr:DUF4200 domain-containing protein [Phycisphaerae bacterium]
MAGIPPQARTGGGVTAVHVWLIVFVILWLAFAVTTVLLAFRQEDLAKQRDDAVAAREGFIKRAEEGQLSAVIIAARDNKRSVAGEVRFRQQELARRITGAEQDDLDTVKAKIKAVLDRIVAEAKIPAPGAIEPGDEADVALLDVVQQMYAWLATEKQRADQADAQADDLAKQRDDAIAARDMQRNDFDQRVAAMEEQVKQMEQQSVQFEQKTDDLQKEYVDARTNAERARDEETRKLTDRLRELEADNQRLSELVDRQGDIIQQFRPKTEQWSLATQADGRVLTALPGDPIVYIDLGRQVTNPITLGLSFKVHAADKPVPEGGQGKATIEVVGIYSDTSACKIIESTPGDPVVEGDYVVNPIYDRNHRYRFVVLGTFDLNGDGIDDPQGEQTVEGLIGRWGGQVVDALDARTDFVVLGRRPQAVGGLSPDATAQQVEQYRQVQQRAVRYDSVLVEAKALRVTILTQNQFLSFVSRSKGLARAGL